MKMKDKGIKINFKNIVQVFLAISGILSLSPYFIWENYSAVASLLAKGFLVLTLFTSFFYLISIPQRVHKKNIIMGISLILFFSFAKGHTWDGSWGWNIGIIVAIGLLLVYLLLQDEEKSEVYKKFSWLFAILLIPAIFVSVCMLLGIELNHEVLQSSQLGKSEKGYYYRKYFLALAFDNMNYSGGIEKFRLCSVFDEPGVVGTISSLLLVGSKYKIKGDFKNKILLIAGALSFSLAFYIITISYFILSYKEKYLGKKNMLRDVVPVLIIISAVNIAFKVDNNIINYNITNKFYNFIHGVDNRTSITYDFKYNEYLGSNDVFLGRGEGAKKNDEIMMSSSSYKDLIYDYGIFGFLYFMGWIIAFGLLKTGKDKDGRILLFMFCLSIYQRPNVLALPFMIVLHGGFAYLIINKKRDVHAIFKGE